MKKIGIVGGVGWPSTMDYYRLICSGANARFRAQGHPPPLPTPPIAIESVNQAWTRGLRGTEGDEASWAGFDAAFRDAFLRLEAAGCDFGLIASNTPHARLHAIRQGVTMPIVDLLEEASRTAAATGAQKALVLGTSVTMRGTIYPRLLADLGLEPNPRLPEPEIEAMQHLIDHEFYSGATPTGAADLIATCRRLVANPSDTVVLLACTELPLAFPAHADDPVFEAEGFRFVNTSAAHAAAALEMALS